MDWRDDDDCDAELPLIENQEERMVESENHEISSFGVQIMDFEGYSSEDEKIGDSIRLGNSVDIDNKILEIPFELEVRRCEDEEIVGISDGRGSIVHDGNEEPFIGMEFESEQAAMIYYDAYAKIKGFIIRVGNCHRSGRDGSVISRRFLCNKEGFRLANNKMKRSETRKPRAITREGCHAMIMVRREKSGRWVITKFETEHSHPLGLPSGKGRRGSIQARPQDEKDKKIKELSSELHRANQRLAECREQLDMILNDVERHTNHLTRTVQDVVENVKEIEAEDQHSLSYHLIV